MRRIPVKYVMGQGEKLDKRYMHLGESWLPQTSQIQDIETIRDHVKRLSGLRLRERMKVILSPIIPSSCMGTSYTTNEGSKEKHLCQKATDGCSAYQRRNSSGDTGDKLTEEDKGDRTV